MRVDPDLCHVLACPHCVPHHPALLQRLFELKDSDQARKSHYFAGRYENIYLPPQELPGIDVILDAAASEAARLLGCDAADLQLSFWFNLMQQNDVTLPHTHDVHDEVLSATYYLQIPPQAGRLLLRLADRIHEVEPVEGNFVFFDPGVEHEVTPHLHPTARISLGVNLSYRKSG